MGCFFLKKNIMKNTKLVFVLIAASISIPVYSNNLPPIRDASQIEEKSQKFELQHLDEDLLRQQKLSTQTVTSQKTEKKNVARYTGKQLIENPEILEAIFLDALVNPNKNILPLYIQLYEKVPNRDQSLIDWANAILESDKSLTKTVSAYRRLISDFPNNNFIRFQLAEALFYNQEYEAAKDQFQRLRATTRIPQDIAILERFIDTINKKEDWSFSFGLSYLNDKNLSNTAEQGTQMVLPNGGVTTYNTERQKGHGILTNIGADKRWAMGNGRYLSLETGLSSHYYWDNKRYNDINAHVGFGLGYSNAELNIQITPYIDKRWYGGGLNGSNSLKEYSNRYGTNLSLSYWLSQSFKYSTHYSFGYDKYVKDIDKNNYNGPSHSFINSISYLPSSTQYWALSLDLTKKYAADRTNAFNRIGSRLTWGQEWPLGVSSSVTLGIGKRDYRETSLLGIKQSNKEYSSSVSLWHKALHFGGFTPRLTWTYNKIKSNMPIYSYDKNQTFVELNKTF